MRIAMIGSGYVGLVSGACLADFGHSVTCVDKNLDRIEQLRRGIMPIFEPGLSDLIESNVQNGRISFVSDLELAVPGADAVFIAVGTPSRRGDGHADLTYLYAAAREIAQVVSTPTVVIIKSTVPVGTGDVVERIIAETNHRAAVDVASNPEFLRQGAAIQDFKRPDRLVLGAESETARSALQGIYQPLYLSQTPFLFTSRRTAELIKYAANAFLATKIGFINEIADLCEKVGADIQEVARGIGLDNRIGAKFLHAGPGYGGSCFPKDTLALIKTAQDYNAQVRIVETVAAGNDLRKRRMGRRIIEACGGTVRGKTIGLLGLTFKPNTDDLRDAPSISIVRELQDGGAHIRAYDPVGMDEARRYFDGIDYATDPYTCADGADALVLVTEWEPFQALDLAQVRKFMRVPVFVDLRNVYAPADMARQGFIYVSIGRAIHEATPSQPLAIAAE